MDLPELNDRTKHSLAAEHTCYHMMCVDAPEVVVTNVPSRHTHGYCRKHAEKLTGRTDGAYVQRGGYADLVGSSAPRRAHPDAAPIPEGDESGVLEAVEAAVALTSDPREILVRLRRRGFQVVPIGDV